MYLIQLILRIFLLCHLQSIAFAQASNEIFPRAVGSKWNITLKGFPVEGTKPPGPITADDINRYVDQIVELADYVVDGVRETDAIFLQFFGEASYHKEVIDIFRRLAGGIITSTDVPKKLEIVAEKTPPAKEMNAKGEPRTLVAKYEDRQGMPTLILYEEWATLEDFLHMLPGATAEGQLERFRATRQGVLLHAMVQFVGDSSIYGTVLSPFPSDGPFENGSIMNVDVIDAGDEAERQFMHEFTGLNETQLTNAKAIGERNVLLISQLGDGPFTVIHNADTYALFAIAIVPVHGPLVDLYKAAEQRDPFNGTASPFRGSKEYATRVNVWWSTSGRRKDL
ncbi:hypothetical protein HYFRA_00000940 [Hymenoscyphus fraxineus]|uniref:Uncharacterized protein n=1 Tax=Hymenoscyphus fraxineus TaxID=746836 RepID=A0A9N9KU63_9HELO|nr:hypothetical protein HYFRA_00000940 [Hymenoscyphus fraxineus]